MSIRLLANMDNMFENIDQNFLSDVSCHSATGWNRSLDLRNYPTKPEDLEIKVDGENLVVSGKSDVSKEQNGFKVFSTHVWSKEFKLNDKIDKDTIKATMDKRNFLKITAQHKEKNDDQFEIPIQMN